MKNMKKLLALVLALMLTLSVGSALAAAADASTTYQVSSFAVSGIAEGNKLTLYKIATPMYDNTTNNLTYEFVDGLTEADFNFESTGYSFNVTPTARAKADDLANKIIEGTITASDSIVLTAGTSGVSTTNLPAGYYVGIVSGTASSSDIYQHLLINAMPVVNATTKRYEPAADMSFAMKKTTTTITKGVGDSPDHTADVQTTDAYGVKVNVGDTVPYEIKTTIPNYPNPSKYAKFVITDTPRNLTDTVASVKVTVAGDGDTGSTTGSITGKFTVAAAGSGFTVTFDKDYILAHPGAAVTVNYNAVITDAALLNAETGLTADNTAKITFNPNPNFEEEVEPEDKTEDYTYGLDVFKYEDGTDPKVALTGAKFILYAADGATVVRQETEVDTNGHISWNKLAAGTYKLVETVAPTGYRLDSTPIDITISKTTATADDRTTDGVTENYFLQKDVPNTPGASLPSTGGIGTTIFYAAGLVMVLGAAVVLISRRKAEAED